jgi:beta-glucosidase
MQSPMKILFRAVLGASLMSGVIVPFTFAADKPATEKPATEKPKTPAAAAHEAADAPNPKHSKTNPEEPEPGFEKRHEEFMRRKERLLKHGGTDLLLVGDSITDGWHNGAGRDILDENYGQYHPYNIGIGGDRTQHVLWRLDKGEVDGISPKLAVLMIGTNNLHDNTDVEIEAGVTKIVKELNTKLPKTKVLLLGIFPRGVKATDPSRARIKTINEVLAKLDDGGKTIKYLDIGPKFLEADGTLPPEIMPDALHPNEKGYGIWAEAMAPAVAELMK